MKMQEISKRYLDNTTGYISIKEIINYINELYNHNFIVSVVEFLKINETGTQPFMEYSIRNENAYSREEILLEITKLNEKLYKTKIKENEMFFEVLVKNNNP